MRVYSIVSTAYACLVMCIYATILVSDFPRIESTNIKAIFSRGLVTCGKVAGIGIVTMLFWPIILLVVLHYISAKPDTSFLDIELEDGELL